MDPLFSKRLKRTDLLKRTDVHGPCINYLLERHTVTTYQKQKPFLFGRYNEHMPSLHGILLSSTQKKNSLKTEESESNQNIRDNSSREISRERKR